MRISRRRVLTGAAAGAATVAGLPHIWIRNMDYAWAEDAKEIKVGVLYSLTGTTAIIEKSMSQVTQFAIDQINKSLLDQVEEFFISYNKSRGKKFKVKARRGAKHAVELVEGGISAFEKRK